MKRNLLLLALTALVAGQGCLNTDKAPWVRQTTEVKAPAPAPVPAGPPPVTDEGLSAANASQRLDALEAEVAGAARAPRTPPAGPPQQ
jgi:hypothetical protein